MTRKHKITRIVPHDQFRDTEAYRIARERGLKVAAGGSRARVHPIRVTPYLERKAEAAKELEGIDLGRFGL